MVVGRFFQFLAFFLWAIPAFADDSSWGPVEKILGCLGIEKGSGFEVSIPRTDLNVLVDDVTVDPELVLTNRFFFRPLTKGTFLSGELVLLDSEIPKVLSRIEHHGFQVTALYAPLLNESPSIRCLDLTAEGSRSDLAWALKNILYSVNSSPSVMEPSITPGPSSSETADWSIIKDILGPSQESGKILEYQFPRSETIEDENGIIPPWAGVATCLRFERSGSKTLASGYLVLTASEVPKVLAVLGSTLIKVVSLQSQLSEEMPRLFYLHFWGEGDEKELAAALASALSCSHWIAPQKQSEPAFVKKTSIYLGV